MNSFCSICFVCQTRTPILIVKRHQSERLHSSTKVLESRIPDADKPEPFQTFQRETLSSERKKMTTYVKEDSRNLNWQAFNFIGNLFIIFFLQGLIYHLNSSYRCIMAVPEDGTRKILHKKEGKQLWQPSLFTNVLILFNKESHPPSPC